MTFRRSLTLGGTLFLVLWSLAVLTTASAEEENQEDYTLDQTMFLHKLFSKGDFTCSITGASGQGTCDASTADDGSTCVWCSLQSFGVCVSEIQAEALKKTIPGLTCDDDIDDDATPNDDDNNTADDDNNVPDDYWECLKNYSDADSCAGAGCTWCDTKAGYGICFDTDAAKSASKSDWFDCKLATDSEVQSSVTSTNVMSCLSISIQGDKELCEQTDDESGHSCEWCSMDLPSSSSSSLSLCLTKDLADLAVELGGVCSTPSTLIQDSDPFDTSCLAASAQGDEAACKATSDEDGNSCEWCSVNDIPLCLTGDQAQIAEALGGECSATTVTAHHAYLMVTTSQ